MSTKPSEKKSSNTLLKITILLAVIIVTYFIAWFQLYTQANVYYVQAMKNYESKNYITALKGEGVLTLTGEGGYNFTAGFEQVVNEFSSPYAIPKPAIYYKALKMTDDIIGNKLTPDMGYTVYQNYYGIDNDNIGKILLRVGDIYAEKGNIPEALKAYNLALDSFPFNSEIAGQANKKIQSLTTR